jgi:hypothetical protein
MHIVLVAAIVFLGVFTQSLSGFGSALVTMALLPALIPIQIAAPLVALVGLTIEISLLTYYHRSLSLRAVLPLVAASVLGIPIGILALRRIDADVFMLVLGLILAGYALYSLFNFRLPDMAGRGWAYLAGFLGGLLGGAYNTSGPPVIIYGNSRRWPPLEFKANLFGFFFVNSLLVVVGHAFDGNLTPSVWRYYLWSLPAILLGLFLGTRLDRYLNPQVYRKIVFILLIIMGVRMIVASLAAILKPLPL